MSNALTLPAGPLADAAYDEDLLHDLALGRLGTSKARFEVEGADLAVPDAPRPRGHPGGVAEKKLDEFGDLGVTCVSVSISP